MAKKKKDNKVYNTTKEWAQYEEGIRYKQNIKLFDTVKENYNFFIGNQWEGLKGVDDLPKPVFNFIQPIMRYKRATVMANDTKIIYAPLVTGDEKYDDMCSKTCAVMSMYANSLRERLQLDYHNELLVTDAAIMGSAFTYWYWNEDTEEVDFDAVDVTNIFPGDVNTTALQKQPYIIISFRRDVEQLKQEARNNAKNGYNDLSDNDIDNLTGDNETRYESGDHDEITEEGKPTKIACLLKMWRDAETKTIHIQKSVKNFVIRADYDTELAYYPVASMIWEPNKNSFFGISDITSMIPNQKFANKMAAMMQFSAILSAFPKTVFNADMIDSVSNKIGEAIAVHGANSLPVNEIVGYIAPPTISPDATRLFNSTIDLTKQLHSASDAALGTANTTSASGRAILLQMEASATPLETTRRRFYNYLEDCARIWFDMWQVYQGKGKTVNLTNALGDTAIIKLSAKEIAKTKATVRIDVGPCSRYSEAVVAESLDNLLMQKFIPFEWWVEWIPDSLGMPKNEMLKKIKDAKEEQQKQALEQAKAQSAQQTAAGPGQQAATQNKAQQPQPQPEQAKQPQEQQRQVTDAQIQQLAQAIANMEPKAAKAAIVKLGQEDPQIASSVLKALPPEFTKQMRAA